MILLICKKLQHVKPRVSTIGHGYLFSTSSLKHTLNSSNSKDPQSLTVSYLLNSCGLSSESAISASKKLQLETTDQPDLVLKLLKTHGLTQTHIRNLITSRPGILLADPSKTLKPNIELFGSLGLSGTTLATILSKTPHILESSNTNSAVQFFKTHGFSEEQITSMILKSPRLFTFNPQKILKPKMEFLRSLGFSASEVVKLVSTEPFIFSTSLENRIIPCVRVLKRTVHTDENVLKVIWANHRILHSDLEKTLVSNVSTLLNLGVPESNVLKLIMCGPRALLKGTEQFNKIVLEVTKLDFDPKKLLFLLAMRSIVIVGKTGWEQKWEVFSSFGLSRDEMFLAFKLQPMCVLSSKKKIRDIMNFLVTRLNLEPSIISRHPHLLLLSLEKRIIPRCSVLQLLLSKDLIKGDINLVPIFRMTHKNFVEKFVTKYQHMVPEVVKAHRGEMEFRGFNTNQMVQVVS